jgi:hypothetical protein
MSPNRSDALTSLTVGGASMVLPHLRSVNRHCEATREATVAMRG